MKEADDQRCERTDSSWSSCNRAANIRTPMKNHNKKLI